jgi:hypothetical protein
MKLSPGSAPGARRPPGPAACTRRAPPAARKASGRPKRCTLAHAFRWKHSCERLKLAQLLGQLGVFLTLRPSAGFALAIPAPPEPTGRPEGKGKIHRVDPDFGSTLTVSNRDPHSNCWVSWKTMAQPCGFQPHPKIQRAGDPHEPLSDVSYTLNMV